MARTARSTTRRKPRVRPRTASPDAPPKRPASPRAATATVAAPTQRSAAERTSTRATPKPSVPTGRFAAADIALGMTPPEVRAVAGQPMCILFGGDDHVEWQFHQRGVDRLGAPTTYVTALSFGAGRVARIIERTAEDS